MGADEAQVLISLFGHVAPDGSVYAQEASHLIGCPYLAWPSLSNARYQ